MALIAVGMSQSQQSGIILDFGDLGLILAILWVVLD